MESIWLEYAWALLILIGLEGLLSADNALVLAVIAKHLPEEQKKKAINYGIILAFVFRFGALFAISFIANVWQIQAIGAAYLLYLGLKHVIKTKFGKKNEKIREDVKKNAAGKSYWLRLVKLHSPILPLRLTQYWLQLLSHSDFQIRRLVISGEWMVVSSSLSCSAELLDWYSLSLLQHGLLSCLLIARHWKRQHMRSLRGSVLS